MHATWTPPLQWTSLSVDLSEGGMLHFGLGLGGELKLPMFMTCSTCNRQSLLKKKCIHKNKKTKQKKTEKHRSFTTGTGWGLNHNCSTQIVHVGTSAIHNDNSN